MLRNQTTIIDAPRYPTASPPENAEEDNNLDEPPSEPFSASYDVPLATEYVPAHVHIGYRTHAIDRTGRARTCLDVDVPDISVHNRRSPAGKVQRVPDVAAAAQEVRTPAVAHVDRVRAEREVERVLRVPRPCGGRRDVLLCRPRARERLRPSAGSAMNILDGRTRAEIASGVEARNLRRRRTICSRSGPSRLCGRQSESIPEARSAPRRVHAVRAEIVLTPLRLTMPGASRVAPVYHQYSVLSDVSRIEKLTVEDADLGSDVVIIGIELRYFEVLVVIRRVQQVGRLCGWIKVTL